MQNINYTQHLEHEVAIIEINREKHLNALNTENVVGVYEGTGEAGEDGWIASPEGQVWLKGNPIGENFYYDRLRDSSNWSNPRMVRFGLSYSL